MARLTYICEPNWYNFLGIRKWTAKYKQNDSSAYPYLVFSEGWPMEGFTHFLNAFSTARQAEEYITDFPYSVNYRPVFARQFSDDDYKSLKSALLNKQELIKQAGYNNCTKCGFEYPYGGPAICSGCNLWSGQYL